MSEERLSALRSAGRWATAFVFGLVWVIYGGTNAASVAVPGMEPEMRCCFTPEEAKNTFWIKLFNVERPVAHFRVSTPTGKMAGFDPRSNMFYSPSPEAVYAGYFEGSLRDSPEWHWTSQIFVRNPTMTVKRLLEGEYRVDVIGIRTGRYSVTFDPVGYGDTRGTVQYGYPDAIPIAPGEIHTYTFNGKFDDVRDGRINPLTSPTYFRVKRVK